MLKKLINEGLAKAIIYCFFSISIFSFLFFWHNARTYSAATQQAAPVQTEAGPKAADLTTPLEADVKTALPVTAQTLDDILLEDALLTETEEAALAYRKEKWLDENGENLPDMDAVASEIKRINAMGFSLPNVLDMDFVGDYYATSYCCEPYKHICGGNGVTASGTVPTQGLTCAADWSVLPRFTWLYIEGVGIRRVEDTGSAIKKARLDIAVDTHDNALRWRGQGNHRVWVLAWG